MDILACRTIIEKALRGQEAAMLALLKELVDIDSPTDCAEGVRRVGQVCADWLAKEGFSTACLPHAPVPEDEAWQADLATAWTARHGAEGAGPGIGFIGHMDTVFPVGTARRRPFTVDLQADRVYGPGVADMKGGLVAMLFAARTLAAHKLLPCPLTLMFSSDEELGSPTSSQALRTHLRGAHAVFCAEPGGVGGRVTLSRKGSGHMHIRVQGVAAHAGRDYANGASAVLALARKVLAYDSLVDLPNGVTVNTGLISGGTSANSVAPWAEARLHLTYRRLADGERVVESIRRMTAEESLPHTRATASGGLRLYPLERTAAGDRLFDLVQEAGRLLDMPLEGQHYESAAESGFCSSVLGIPTICCMGPEGEHIHSDKEYMVLSSLVPRAMLLALSAVMAARTDFSSPAA